MKYKICLSALSLILSATAFAAPKVNPSNVPLETGIGSLVKPNLMFIFDNSSSMSRNYLGDTIGESNRCTGYYPPTPPTIGIPWNSWKAVEPKVNHNTQAECDATLPPNEGPGTNIGDVQYKCSPEGYYVTPKTCSGQVGDSGGQTCTGGEWVYYNYHIRKGVVQEIPGKAGYRWLGDRPCNNGYAPTTFEPLPPFAAPAVNQQYYNPNVIYKPGVKYDGTSYGDQSITSARVNIYSTSTSTINLLTQATEPYWCTTKTPTAAQLNDPSVCRRNGVDGDNPFNYYDTTTYPTETYHSYVSGPSPNPFYYDVIPVEFCDVSGINCALIQNQYYPIPFPVRWCNSWSHASNSSLVSGAGKCKASSDSTHKYPRLGKLKRVTIPSDQYTNYANWFTYYRTRLLSMKTSSGLAFAAVDSNKRVGFISLNTPSSFHPVGDFSTVGGSTSHKAKFYEKLYALTGVGDTDLKKSLSQVGKYFAGISSGISAGMINGTTSKDPVQYSCQQNFALLATDGYWNPGTFGKDLSESNIANVDNVNSADNYSLRIDGVFDGNIAGSTGTLSDVALYYYKTPLRDPSLNNCMSNSSGSLQNLCGSNVPISAQDQNPNQHMVTYAMSLGLSGLMNYTKDYNYGTSTDLQNVKNGTLGACPWVSGGSTGVCDWPVPNGNDPAALDDLWHATISGRGKYFSAKDSSEAIASLQDALTSVSAQTGSSAAAATSSPNITATDNALFYATYRTAKWDGEIVATTVDPTTGVISSTPKWSAKTLLNGRVSSASDTRNIYYVRNTSGGSSLRSFTELNMDTTEMNNFKNKCADLQLSQCINLSSPNKAKVDNGTALITYLRGQSQYDVNNAAEPLFRPREFVLGDIVNSSPTYVSKPNYNWTDANYGTFITANASRSPTLYVGANDGMIHAFDATTGQEKWAIIPSQMMNKLYKLADTTYATSHDFFVDGTISVMDAKINGTWKTVLISGMNSGGKGYIALDVTNPDAPTVLWEMCNTSACSVNDPEVGYTYGNPIITKRKFDGKWVSYLSAGYDNSTGKGLIYEVDLADGNILRKLYTGTGGAFPLYSLDQAGIAKINASYGNFSADNTALALYAGDLDGRVWKWDLNDSAQTTATALGRATDPSGNPQPITTKIEIGRVNNNVVLFFGTGKFLNNTDFSTTQTQSVYAIKDSTVSYGNFRNNNSLVKQTLTPSTITTTGTNIAVDLTTKNGWYFDLISQSGERVNVDPALALGVLNLVTNIPGTSACTAGGEAWMYQIDFATGTAVDQTNGFIAKKMDSGLAVGQVIVQLGQLGGLKNYITDASGKISTVTVPTSKKNNNQKLKKYFWKEIQKR